MINVSLTKSGVYSVKEDVPAYALNPQSVQEMRAGFNRPVADVFN